MEMNRMIAMFMEYCKSKQLRERTMLSYEQSLKLFAVWLEDVEEITHVEKIKEMNTFDFFDAHVRSSFVLEVQPLL